MTTQTILVGTDFSDASRAALDWAVDAAKTFGARVVLAHVSELPSESRYDEVRVVPPAETAAHSGALDAEILRVHERGVKVEPALSQGEPSDNLLALARGSKAGLIVIGSHRRRGMDCAQLGNTTDAILRASHVPVTVVRIRVEGSQ